MRSDLGLIALLAFAMPASASAAREPDMGAPAIRDTVRGRVSDAEGHPVSGAVVVLVELDRRVTANEDGAFVLAGVPAGRHTVVVQLPGYAPFVRVLDVHGSATIEAVLQASPFTLDPVTVTATRTAMSPAESPLPADALTSEDLRREHSVSLAHSLNALAGVRTLGTGMEIGKPVIRGLTGSRVLVLENGLPLEDLSWSDEDGPSVDARLAERVEVIRGPASVLYGSDALGGVVNVIPAPLPDAVAGSSFVDGSIETYGASNNHELGGALGLEGAGGPFGWHLNLVARGSEALHTPQGELENTGFGSVAGDASVGLAGSWGSGRLRYSRYGGEFKLLEVEGPPPGGEPAQEAGPERKLSDDRVQLSWSLPLGGIRLEPKAQWQRHWLQEIEDVIDPTTGQRTEEPVFEFLLNTVTTDILAHHARGRVHGTLGVSGEWQDQDSRGTEPIVPDAMLLTAGAFAFEQYDVGKASIIAGARVDTRRLEADANADLGTPAQTRSWTAGSGDVGLAYRPVDGVTVTANVGRGWRAPNLFELYAAGPRIGELLYEVGRSDLATEKALNVDLGVRWELGAVHGGVSAYRNGISDYIYLSPTGDFVDTLRVYQHRQADATLLGGEVSVEAEPVRLVTVRGTLSYVRATNDETGEPLPLTPPPSGTLGAEVHPTVGWADELYVGTAVEAYAKQTRLSEFDTPTDAYALLHFSAGLTHRFGSRPVRLALRVRNATNASYRDFLSRYKEFALDPGRNIVLRLSTVF